MSNVISPTDEDADGQNSLQHPSWHPAFRPEDSYSTPAAHEITAQSRSIPSMSEQGDTEADLYESAEQNERDLPESVGQYDGNSNPAELSWAAHERDNQPSVANGRERPRASDGAGADSYENIEPAQDPVLQDKQALPPSLVEAPLQDEQAIKHENSGGDEFGAHFIANIANEDDENDQVDNVDPSWGLKRTESDAFNVLGHLDRSTSFPEFLSKQPDHALGTQAETILEDAEAEETNTDGYVDGGEIPGSSAPTGYNAPSWFQDEPTLEDNSQTPFFDNIGQQAETTEEPSDAEARYEEGLLLVHEHEPSEMLHASSEPTPKSIDDFFGSAQNDAEESFFNKTAPSKEVETEASKELPRLDRKDTSQVISSMHFENHEAHGRGHLSDVLHNNEEGINVLKAIPDQSKEEDLDSMWKAALDDDEFLVEDPDDLLSDSSDDSRSSFLDQLQQGGGIQQPNHQVESQLRPQTQRSSGSYTPHQPSTSDLAQGLPGGSWGGNVGLSKSALPPMNFPGTQAQRPNTLVKAESFVDQSKGGYKSPYDLPENLSARPKKRIQVRPSTQNLQSNVPPPPPRSSSMTSDQGNLPPQRGMSQYSPVVSTFPTTSRPSTASNATPSLPPIGEQGNHHAAVKPKASNASFFEELPVASRTRPPTAQGRYTPMQTSSMATPPPISAPQNPRSSSHAQFQAPLANQPVSTPPPAASRQSSYTQYELQKPERIDPYANILQQPPAPPALATSRYSPAPPGSNLGPRVGSAPRYSPAPPQQSSGPPSLKRYASQSQVAGPPVSTATSFQPRTSSPLAHHEKGQTQQFHGTPTLGATSSPPVSPPSRRPPQSTYSQQMESQRRGTPLGMDAGLPQTSSKSQIPPLTQKASSHYTPQQGHNELLFQGTAGQTRSISQLGYATIGNEIEQAQVLQSTPVASLPPPRRSQTQSPGKMDAPPSNAYMQPSLQRPASVQGQSRYPNAAATYDPIPQGTVTRQRDQTPIQNFISPTDGTHLDELQRWRGSPVFHFTPGGAIVTCFPAHLPRYMPGQSMPFIKATAGETKVRNAKDVLNVDAQTVRFPGPLRSKSKKKEVIAWLSERIAHLEQIQAMYTGVPQLPDPQVSRDEKIMLWKILKIIVEYDGVVEGKPVAQKALTAMLAPDLQMEETSNIGYSGSQPATGIHKPSGTQIQPRPADLSAVEQIRKNLMRGDREKAVWDAVDSRLWAHAMLLASTLDNSVWKQVVQEFVRQEVKATGENTESLAAVYQIFGGNLEDSIDELVPPSARAGLQMVSKVTINGPTKNALEGLNRWRETLCLVLNNRSNNDHQAIASLGRLLASYGRVEASHICFLLSGSPASAIFGGADEPQSSIVLLGIDHRQTTAEISNDEDAIILTEVFEFATSVLATNASTSALLPHLQAYKLHRALMLAETGHKAEALQYCDAIGGSLKSTTKLSPYYHPHFFAELDELSIRLRQTPFEGSSSWKPSMEKVSGSLLSRFNTFVTGGEDSDAVSNGSGKDANHEFGPFAKVTGTPTISREASNVDMYSAYTSGGSQPIAVTAANSRYAPKNQSNTSNAYTPRNSSEQMSRPSLEVQRSQSYAGVTNQRSPSYDSTSFGAQNYAATVTPSLGSPYPAMMNLSSQYQSTPPSSSHMPTSSSGTSPYAPQSYAPTPGFDSQSYEPVPSRSPYQHSPCELVAPVQESQSYVPTPEPGQLQSYQPATMLETQSASFDGYQPHAKASPSSPQQPLQPLDDAPNEMSSDSTYTPYGYEPPSNESTYVPYEPEPDSDDDDTSKNSALPKKKPSIMDLDEGAPDVPQVPVNKALDRARKDAETDAAFRAAAEADAQRAKQPTLKSKPSWFGGWFAGKAGDLDSGKGDPSAGGPKVVRAKLGEESSFYYDKDLKKWVNKKDPGSATSSARATPPPPRVGPSSLSRSTSGMGPPPGPTGPPRKFGLPVSASLPSIPNPPSRSESPISVSNGPGPSLAPPTPLERTVSSSGGPPTPSAQSSGPGTPALATGAVLGPPSAIGVKPMSAVSSIDDLLGGPPQPRKAGGTLRGQKKKTAGYVDVMAQK